MHHSLLMYSEIFLSTDDITLIEIERGRDLTEENCSLVFRKSCTCPNALLFKQKGSKKKSS